MATGPLAGVKVLELAGIGPGPFCCMMLADMGADVVRIDRADKVKGGDPAKPPPDVLARGRRSVAVDLKQPEGVETVLKLVEQADVINTFQGTEHERPIGFADERAVVRLDGWMNFMPPGARRLTAMT